MKKRILSLLLALALCFMLLPVQGAMAAQDKVEGTDAIDAQAALYSSWAEQELMVGDTYGIYPMGWYQKGMMRPIKNGQLRVLIAGVRIKLLKTGFVKEARINKPAIDNEMSVEEVLNAFYSVLSCYDYTKDIGLTKQFTPTEYMKVAGIFTGEEGELKLSDICTVEQACVIATRMITYVYDLLDASSKGFLWATKSGGNTVYMLGSIHAASYDIYPFSDTILNAYEASDALAVEINILDTDAGVDSILKYALYTDGTKLKDHVSEETYKKTVELASQFGYPEGIIAMFKPWYVYTLFSAMAVTDTGSAEEVSLVTNLGIDMKFLIDATQQNKQILEVENYELQIKMLDSFSDELEEYLLSSTIDAVIQLQEGKGGSEDEGNLDELLTYWHDGDVEAFREYIAPEYELPEALTEEDAQLKALTDEYQNKVMTQRDLGMADYIDQLLKSEGSKTYFVVVGSGHYISDYSVLDILEEKGYTITQIK